MQALEELKAQDVVSIDTRQQSNVMDCMLICTGSSHRHVMSIADNLIRMAKQAKVPIIGSEGLEGAEWVLVDLGDVVVHIMQLQARDYYQLERLWQPFEKEQFNPVAQS